MTSFMMLICLLGQGNDIAQFEAKWGFKLGRGIDQKGVIVLSVEKGKPASQMKLLPGDQVIKVGEKVISTLEEFKTRFSETPNEYAITVISKENLAERFRPRQVNATLLKGKLETSNAAIIIKDPKRELIKLEAGSFAQKP
jgi:S1-C subfamily serine protease